MRLSTLIARTFWVLTLLSVLSTFYVYLYPAFHRCGFPEPSSTSSNAPPKAPLRLLALGDPQLEGETSLPNVNSSVFPCLYESWERHLDSGDFVPSWPELRNASWSFLTKDMPGFVQTQRKRLDLWGNDYYLAHIYRTVRWWTQPTHMVVLGDLLGSQWIDVEQFHARADRYFDRVFRGSARLPAREELEEDLESAVDWSRNVINLAGNHDIGYAGDFDTHRLERFKERFAPLNWDLEFRLDSKDGSRLVSAASGVADSPRVHIIILNSMNLDSPAYNKSLQKETVEFLEDMKDKVGSHSEQDAVVLLTHIPLYKEEGICVDGPMFKYFPEENGCGVSEQNHLSEESSLSILDGLFSSAEKSVRAGMILNGHDHEGCDVLHGLAGAEMHTLTGWNKSTLGEWTSMQYMSKAKDSPAKDEFTIREVTVRSMMGSYGGNAGLVSGWYDNSQQRWRFEYSSCMFGVQHIWWTVHILDLVTLCLGVATALVHIWTRSSEKKEAVPAAKKNQ